ncbi:unnamed protein product, partial [Symbiodinium sp. CCMP2592]
ALAGKGYEASLLATAAAGAAGTLRKTASRGGLEVSREVQEVARLHEEAAKEVKSTLVAGKVNARGKVKMIISLDKAYHRLRYLCASFLGAPATETVPAPHVYFASFLPSGDGVQRTLRQMSEAAGTEVAAEAGQMLGLGESLEENPLASLLQTRWVESGALLAAADLLPSLGDCSDGPPGDTMKSPDPRTSQLVREWRDSVRVWACHLYSYAVPSERALRRLAAEAPLLEIGAGTGYWAYMLRRRSVVVHAYDIRLARDDNEYHGHSPAWTRVERGGPEAAANHAGSALFLCYPPPGNMALQVLNFFPGDRVLLVGEWSGDTASQKFQEKLMQTFELVETVPLPNWADTAAALSVWQRRHWATGVKEM